MSELLGRPLVLKEFKKRGIGYYVGRVLVGLGVLGFTFLSGYLCKALE